MRSREADPTWVGDAGGGIVSHFLFVSLIGVKKRTKVIKNSVNPVWNEVCEFFSLLPFLTLCCHRLWGQVKGLVQERSRLSGIVLSRRGGAGGPVCQLDSLGARNLGGWSVAWPAK